MTRMGKARKPERSPWMPMGSRHSSLGINGQWLNELRSEWLLQIGHSVAGLALFPLWAWHLSTFCPLSSTQVCQNPGRQVVKILVA